MGPLLHPVTAALVALIEIYRIIVFVAILSSWIDSDNVIFRFARQLTDPVIEPIRRVLPPAGGLDFSPFVLLIGLSLIRNAIL